MGVELKLILGNETYIGKDAIEKRNSLLGKDTSQIMDALRYVEYPISEGIFEIKDVKIGELRREYEGEILDYDDIYQPSDITLTYGKAVGEGAPRNLKWYGIEGTDLLIRVECGIDVIVNLSDDEFNIGVRQEILKTLVAL